MRSAHQASVAFSAARAAAGSRRCEAAVSASRLVANCPSTTDTSTAPPAGTVTSPAKAATRRPSSA